MNEPIDFKRKQAENELAFSNFEALLKEHDAKLSALQADVTIIKTTQVVQFTKLESMLQELLNRVPKS